MKGLMDQQHTLGKPYNNDMAVNLINMSLNKDFGDFVRNFNMHCVEKTVIELHALLIDFKKGLKDKVPTPQVFTIQTGRDNKPKPQANKKVKGKGKADKNKQVVPYQPKSKPNPLKRKENLNKDQACHHCHVVGHWKRNCPFISKSCVQIRSLSPVLQFKVFKAKVELQLGKKIKALRSDRGGEYLSQDFKDYLKSAVRILNMVPTKKVDKTPFEIWHGKVPNLSYLKVWGCEAYVKCDSADKL
nr:hypothetical protein [Tanacetum cinerariifolium]